MDILVHISDSVVSEGQLQIDFTVWGATGVGPYNGEVFIPTNTDATTINVLIKAAADAVMVTNGHTMSAGDNRTIFAGASVNTGASVTSSPGRSLNSTFTPSATKATLVIYTIEIPCTANLSGGQAGRVRLLSDTSSPPTTERCQVYNESSVSLAIALTAVNKQRGILFHFVPPGHKVLLESTQVTGTPTISIVTQTEVTLGS